MLFRKIFLACVLGLLLAGQSLFAQIQLQGVVKNNGDEPVGNALVEVIDQANAGRIFSSLTNSEGEYAIDISTTGIGDTGQKPRSFNLLQNYPNPFNPSTVISYEIPHPAQVRIEIYNVLGQKIKTLLDAQQTNLYGKIIWDGTNDQGRGVSAGVYFYSLFSEGQRINRKMLLLDGHLGEVSTSNAAAPVYAGQPGLLKPQSFTFLLRVSGTDIETWEQQDVLINENKVINVNVIRTVTDFDGNVYRTVKIGNQWWMAENLKTTHYRNGIFIKSMLNDLQWKKATSGARCSYNKDDDNITTYGLLYNWYAVNDTSDLAPEGWRVPTDQDWQELERTLGIDELQLGISYWRGTDQGGKLKESGTTHWTNPNTGATNEYGFNALPGGYRNEDGSYSDMNTNAFFWANAIYNEDHAFYRNLNSTETAIYREKEKLNKGFSVRCVLYGGSPNTPSNLAPEANTTGLYTSVTLSWHPRGGEEWYGLQVSTNPVFTNLFINEDHISSNSFLVTGLSEGTTYYWRVNASCPNGTSNWSEYINFTTAIYEKGTVTDYDGNIYNTVLIGNQWWMTENLKVSHYNNGDEISYLTGDDEWHDTNNTQSGAWCNYLNKEVNNAIYGHLYNWYVVGDERGIAPEGWKVPTDNEWKEMETLLGMRPDEEDSTWIIWFNVSGKLRETGTLHWKAPNDNATNESGFTALPGGQRSSNGSFDGLGEASTFWTSTSDGGYRAIHRRISEWSEINNRNNQSSCGCSIRLMKYSTPPNAPVHISVENNEIDVPKSPILRWHEVNGALSYSLQVALNPDFSGLIVNQSNIDSTTFKVFTLTPATTFYWRVNAKNTEGTSPWSEPWSLTTVSSVPVTGSVTDIDGNVYKTVRIGKQWWMQENLQVTHYRNGEAIPNITDSTAWMETQAGAWCSLNNDNSLMATYGSLYNWFATVDERNIAPEGWHVPTDEDWKILEKHLGMTQEEVDNSGFRGRNEGGMLKETGLTHWNNPNTGATNESGFTALSFGYCSARTGAFSEIGTSALFWACTSSESDTLTSYYRSLKYDVQTIRRMDDKKQYGFSVRCVKD